jgi:hypothetical protein
MSNDKNCLRTGIIQALTFALGVYWCSIVKSTTDPLLKNFNRFGSYKSLGMEITRQAP